MDATRRKLFNDGGTFLSKTSPCCPFCPGNPDGPWGPGKPWVPGYPVSPLMKVWGPGGPGGPSTPELKSIMRRYFPVTQNFSSLWASSDKIIRQGKHWVNYIMCIYVGNNLSPFYPFLLGILCLQVLLWNLCLQNHPLYLNIVSTISFFANKQCFLSHFHVHMLSVTSLIAAAHSATNTLKAASWVLVHPLGEI